MRKRVVNIDSGQIVRWNKGLDEAIPRIRRNFPNIDYNKALSLAIRSCHVDLYNTDKFERIFKKRWQ